MIFKNASGEIVTLADNLTLQELTEMGIDISLVEHEVEEPLKDVWKHSADN